MGSAVATLVEYFVLSAGFLFFVITGVIIAGLGIFHRSRAALGLSVALILPSAFFLSFQPILSYVDELPYWLARYTIWTSIVVSPLVAIPGILKQSRSILMMSAALSVPFGVWFLFYPGTRFYIVLPVLHLIGAATVRTRGWWLSVVMLALILGLDVLFFVGFGGLGLLLGPAVQ